MKIFFHTQKYKWKKIILIPAVLVILLFLILLFLPNILGVFLRDMPSINDSDLRLKNVEVSQSNNAYFDLIKIKEAINYPNEKQNTIRDIVNGKTWDNGFVKKIIFSNSKALEYFSDAANKSKFQNPALADPSKITIDAPFYPISHWKEIAQLKAIQALYLNKQGKSEEAMEQAFDIIRVAQKIQDSQASLIECALSTAIKDLGLETIQKIITSSKLNAVESNQYNQELNQLYNNENCIATALKFEYYSICQHIDLISSGNIEFLGFQDEKDEGYDKVHRKVKNSYYFQPNRTKNLFADCIRNNINNINKSYKETKPIYMQRPIQSYSIEGYFTRNIVGKILYSTTAVDFDGLYKKKCEEDLLVSSTRIIIAIKAFKNNTGNYPLLLNDLTPKYLSLIPKDPFDGNPLKYSIEKKIIYSVGIDLKDSEGSIGDNWREMADPTFKIDF